MRKVLHISNYYYPHIGGIESTCQYLAEGATDFDVRVICFSEDKHDKKEQINGIWVYKAGVCMDIARQSLSFSYLSRLRQVFHEWEPDIVHFHYPNPFVAFLLLLLNMPKETKLYLHWHLDITKQKSIYPFIKPIETWLLRRADVIAVTSPNYRDSSEPLKGFMQKVKILPSAIDLRKYVLTADAETEVVKKIKQDAGGKKIVYYAGRHVLHKGVKVLIEAEHFIKNDCIVYIAGEGPITKEAKELCKSDRVRFLGRLKDEEMKLYYHAADIFVFPSYTKAEAFGLTLAEAMFCHTPAVTFTIAGSGVNWVSLNGATGIEVPNLDVKAYAAAIDVLLEDDILRKKYADNARQRVIDNFTIDKEVATLVAHYSEILKV
jgi:glycosyltransferase involved in cell wall biosynthesis